MLSGRSLCDLGVLFSLAKRDHHMSRLVLTGFVEAYVGRSTIIAERKEFLA